MIINEGLLSKTTLILAVMYKCIYIYVTDSRPYSNFVPTCVNGPYTLSRPT